MIDLRNVRDAAIVGFALALLFLILEIFDINPLHNLDLPVYDAFDRASLRRNDEIVLVDLDEPSAMALGEAAGWPNTWLPSVIDRVKGAKAVAMVFPYLPKKLCSPITSQVLKQSRADSVAKSFRLPPGRIRELIDTLLIDVPDTAGELVGAVRRTGNVFLGFTMLDERYSDRILAFDIYVKQSLEDLRANTAIIDKGDFLAPEDALVFASEGVGYLDVKYSGDGLVREIPLVALCKDKVYPALAFAVYRSLQGNADLDLPQSRALKLGPEEIGLGEGYTYRVHYTSNLGDFTRIPVSHILAGKVSADTFKDKIVLIGSSFEPYAMEVPTPIDGHMSRMVLEANLLTGLVKGSQAVPPHVAVTFVVTLLVAGLGAFAAMLPWRKLTLPGFVVLVFIFYIIMASSAARIGTRISVLTPCFVGALAVTAGYFIYYYNDGRRRTYIQQMVRNYFPADQEKHYIERFMNLPYLKLNRESVVLAVNLDFEKKEKSLQEALKSFEEFRTRLLEICRRRGGMRMYFMGDSSLFLFSDQNAYIQACQASLEIRKFFSDFNAKYQTEGIGEFNLGIGLASGETLVSTIGKVPLVDLAVFGDPVLLARELALLNFELKTRILMEQRLYKHLPADTKVRELGELEIVGKKYVVYEYLR